LTADLDTLRRALRTAGDLRSVARTMKALAAANIRQYQRAAQSLAGFQRTVEHGFQILLRSRPELAEMDGPAHGGRLALILLGSDQGMCGAFNEQLLNFARTELPEIGREPAAIVGVVGSRLCDLVEGSGISVTARMLQPESVAGITSVIQDLVLLGLDWREQHGVARVVICHNRTAAGALHRPRRVDLLPIDSRWLRRLRDRPWPTRALPTFTMEPRALLSSLVRQYLFVVLYLSMAESMASENASRLAAMQAAEHNIDERLDELGLLFHQASQTAVTAELLDIVGGFEVLGDPDA